VFVVVFRPLVVSVCVFDVTGLEERDETVMTTSFEMLLYGSILQFLGTLGGRIALFRPQAEMITHVIIHTFKVINSGFRF
jgi:hypothetical protein